jgi:hypothetical protein
VVGEQVAKDSTSPVTRQKISRAQRDYDVSGVSGVCSVVQLKVFSINHLADFGVRIFYLVYTRAGLGTSNRVDRILRHVHATWHPRINADVCHCLTDGLKKRGV